MVSAAAITILAGTAQADPPPGHNPTLSDIVGVCETSVASLLDDLSAAWNAQNPSDPFYCYDSVNPLTGGTGDPITTKPGCTFARPDGAGVSVLQADQKSTVDGITDCLDFASVERGPGSDSAGLTFLPFAQEALRYATSNPTASFPSVPATNAPQTLTAANLATIYSCGASGTTSHWSDFGAASTDAVEALIPQPGSGIRTFFESSIGVTEATIQAGVNAGCLLQVQDDDPAPIRANADRIGLFDVPLFTTKYSDSGIQLDATGFSATHLD
ncbi:MAG TPA: hypothetical protein VGM75_07015, partial [Pseudonocardiaceae bacterium]